jgi:hypothetical protein
VTSSQANPLLLRLAATLVVLLSMAGTFAAVTDIGAVLAGHWFEAVHDGLLALILDGTCWLLYSRYVRSNWPPG